MQVIREGTLVCFCLRELDKDITHTPTRKWLGKTNCWPSSWPRLDKVLKTPLVEETIIITKKETLKRKHPPSGNGCIVIIENSATCALKYSSQRIENSSSQSEVGFSSGKLILIDCSKCILQAFKGLG
jgi:hypothetical protein